MKSIVVWVGLILATVTPASAQPPSCPSGLELLPGPGSTEVPTNAKLWVLGDGERQMQLDLGAAPWLEDAAPVAGRARYVDADATHVLQFAPTALAAAHHYTWTSQVRALATEFTTSSVADHTAPPAPEVRKLALSIDRSGHPSGAPYEVGFELDANLDPDVAIVRIEVSHGEQTWAMITSVQNLGCRYRAHDDELPFALDDEVAVSVTAIDLAGNESAAVTRTVKVGGIWKLACGAAGLMYVFRDALLTLVIGGLALIGLVSLFTRRRAPAPLPTATLRRP